MVAPNDCRATARAVDAFDATAGYASSGSGADAAAVVGSLVPVRAFQGDL